LTSLAGVALFLGGMVAIASMLRAGSRAYGRVIHNRRQARQLAQAGSPAPSITNEVRRPGRRRRRSGAPARRTRLHH